MRLFVPETLARDLALRARDDAPRETCGLLAGHDEAVHEVIPIANIAPDPARQYQLDSRAFVRAMFDLEARGLSLVGLYHSHPAGDAIPSPVDVAQAAYPDTPYVIIGLKGPDPRLAAWRITHGEVMPVELIIGSPPADSPPTEQPLSPAQKTAILVSALLAFVFVILLSVSLLPPAPLIP